jgi:hypothetical protein
MVLQSEKDRLQLSLNNYLNQSEYFSAMQKVVDW